MPRKVTILIITINLLTGCTPRVQPTSVSSLPSSSRHETATIITNAASQQWTLNFNAEPHRYHSISQITLALDSLDTGHNQDTIAIISQFTVTIDRSQTPVTIIGRIDSLLFEAGSRIGSDIQKVNMPVAFNGTISSNRVTLNSIIKRFPTRSPLENSICNSPASSLLGEVRAELEFIPVQLKIGSRWIDTISTETCSAKTLPSSIQVVRFYQVLGEKNHSGTTVLLIKRTDEIHVTGNGTQNQHQVRLEGEGTGSSDIFLDPATGIALSIESSQELKLAIISSGDGRHFTQRVKQQIALIP